MASRLTRVRAVLAGGLVLGVGAAITVAAWTAQDHSSGAFTASRFVTQASVGIDGSWGDTSVTPAVLFNVSGIAPNTTQTASIGIKTMAGSVGGTESLQTPTISASSSTALWGGLQYRVYASSSNTCSTTIPSGVTWVVGSASTWSPMTTAPPTNSTALAAATSTADGAPTWFCFLVNLPLGASSSLQGQTVVATWVFEGTSS